jgi:hypothetical protein
MLSCQDEEAKRYLDVRSVAGDLVGRALEVCELTETGLRVGTGWSSSSSATGVEGSSEESSLTRRRFGCGRSRSSVSEAVRVMLLVGGGCDFWLGALVKNEDSVCCFGPGVGAILWTVNYIIIKDTTIPARSPKWNARRAGRDRLAPRIDFSLILLPS